MRNALLIQVHIYFVVVFGCLSTINDSNFVVIVSSTSVSSTSSSLLSLSSKSQSKSKVKAFPSNSNSNKNAIQTTSDSNKQRTWKSIFIKEKQQIDSTQEDDNVHKQQTSTITNTACSLYIWNLPLALITFWCNNILQKDCIYEGLGGKKFIRIRPGSVVQYLYPIVYGTSTSTKKGKVLSKRQLYKQQQLYYLLYGERDDYINNRTTTNRNKLIDNCILCGSPYNDHKIKWSSKQQLYHHSVYIYSPYDIYFNTIQQQRLNTTGTETSRTSSNNIQTQQTNKNNNIQYSKSRSSSSGEHNHYHYYTDPTYEKRVLVQRKK